MAIGLGRREFTIALDGVTIAWPLGARAEQAEPVRRLGLLINLNTDDPEAKRRMRRC